MGFSQSSLKTFTSKTTSPIDYTVCENKKNQCPFFTNTSLLDEYCSVLRYRVKQIYKDKPLCREHDKTATLYLSRAKANFNLRFFKSANNLDHHPCSYFQWADQDPNEYTLQSSKITKKAKRSSNNNKKKGTTPIQVTYLTLPVKRMQQFKRAEGVKE